MKDVVIYLDDILESIDRIRQYIQGKTVQEFDDDLAAQDAVARRLEIIGEAVKHLPLSVRKAHSEIPWKQIAGMRDILIHEYAGVSVKTIWNTAKKNLTPLQKMIQKIKKEIG
ncbi:MAG: DUF86 domain-containing protein [Patescibacteria group bacterium]